jgi:hypothetical protein
MVKQVSWNIFGYCGNIARALDWRNKFRLRYFLNGAKTLVGLDMFGMSTSFVAWEHCFEVISLSTSIVLAATSLILGDKVQTCLKDIKGVCPVILVSPRHP